jgi:hypothetical protein
LQFFSLHSIRIILKDLIRKFCRITTNNRLQIKEVKLFKRDNFKVNLINEKRATTDTFVEKREEITKIKAKITSDNINYK